MKRGEREIERYTEDEEEEEEKEKARRKVRRKERMIKDEEGIREGTRTLRMWGREVIQSEVKKDKTRNIKERKEKEN